MIEDTEIEFLTVEDVIQLHAQSMARYSPGESLYLRDRGLLESALYAPQHTFEGRPLYTSIVDMAAVLMESLARNHPFENGNKRVAFGCCSAFLRINGLQLTLTQQEAVNATLSIIDRRIDRDELIDILTDCIRPVP